MPTLTVKPPHVCQRHRPWAVSIGSHLQQEKAISSASRGAMFHLLDSSHRPHSFGDGFSPLLPPPTHTWQFLERVVTRV